MIKPVCAKCGRFHVETDVHTIGRFGRGPLHYETPDGRVFLSRSEAHEWICQQRVESAKPT